MGVVLYIKHIRMVNAIFNGLELATNCLQLLALLRFEDVLVQDLEALGDCACSRVGLDRRVERDGYQLLGKTWGCVGEDAVGGIEVFTDHPLDEFSGPGVLCVAAECRRGEAYCLSGISPLAATGGKRECRQDLGR